MSTFINNLINPHLLTMFLHHFESQKWSFVWLKFLTMIDSHEARANLYPFVAGLRLRVSVRRGLEIKYKWKDALEVILFEKVSFTTRDTKEWKIYVIANEKSSSISRERKQFFPLWRENLIKSFSPFYTPNSEMNQNEQTFIQKLFFFRRFGNIQSWRKARKSFIELLILINVIITLFFIAVWSWNQFITFSFL